MHEQNIIYQNEEEDEIYYKKEIKQDKRESITPKNLKDEREKRRKLRQFLDTYDEPQEVFEIADEAIQEIPEVKIPEAILSPAQLLQKQIESVTKIQKWVRGHLERVNQKRREHTVFKDMRKLRRMLSVAYGRLKKKTIKSLINVLQDSGNLHADQNYRLWQ